MELNGKQSENIYDKITNRSDKTVDIYHRK